MAYSHWQQAFLKNQLDDARKGILPIQQINFPIKAPAKTGAVDYPD